MTNSVSPVIMVSLNFCLTADVSARGALQATLICRPFGVLPFALHSVMNARWLFILSRLHLTLLKFCRSDSRVLFCMLGLSPSRSSSSSCSVMTTS